jgi:hypothetical protein
MFLQCNAIELQPTFAMRHSATYLRSVRQERLRQQGASTGNWLSATRQWTDIRKVISSITSYIIITLTSASFLHVSDSGAAAENRTSAAQTPVTVLLMSLSEEDVPVFSSPSVGASLRRSTPWSFSTAAEEAAIRVNSFASLPQPFCGWPETNLPRGNLSSTLVRLQWLPVWRRIRR